MKARKATGRRCCAICGANGMGDPLEKHHVFGGAYRRKSERYGAVEYLCGRKCHKEGKRSVHRCAEESEKLKRTHQIRIMEEQGWDVERWIREFGRSYLE